MIVTKELDIPLTAGNGANYPLLPMADGGTGEVHLAGKWDGKVKLQTTIDKRQNAYWQDTAAGEMTGNAAALLSRYERLPKYHRWLRVVCTADITQDGTDPLIITISYDEEHEL